MTGKEWFEVCETNYIGMTDKQYEELRPQARRDGRVELNGSNKKWYPTKEEMERRSES
jgi:hypothetical protein